MKPIKQNVVEMPDPAYAPKLVTRVEPDGLGYEITLSCGHTSWWVIAPPMTKAHCSTCLSELLDRLKKQGYIR